MRCRVVEAEAKATSTEYQERSVGVGLLLQRVLRSYEGQSVSSMRYAFGVCAHRTIDEAKTRAHSEVLSRLDGLQASFERAERELSSSQSLNELLGAEIVA